METQATRATVGQKVFAVLMSIVLVLGLSPMLPYNSSAAYAADDATAAQADLADGTYQVTGLTSSLGMFHFDADSVIATISGDAAFLSMTVTEAKTIARYDGMASGAASAVIDKADETKHTLVAGTEVAEVADVTDDTGAVVARTFVLPVDKDALVAGAEIPYTLKYREGYSEDHNGDWYAGSKDYFFNAGYELSAPAAIEITNNVKMFSIAGAELSADGTQLTITMGSDSYGKVALSKARKADEETNYAITDRQVVLPVSELGDGARITTSWWSISHEQWYERDLTFNAEAKTLQFDVTPDAVDVIDALGTVEAVKAAIVDGSLVVTPELVDEMIAAIQVQARDDNTDFYCATARVLWDSLSAADQEMVEEGDYFARDTGDASADDPLNQDMAGENEILVVSFGTSFNDSRVADIGGVEKAIQSANPEWIVRRAFTAQIIINHVQARDGEAIDNMDQALERAVANGVKNLVVQPTHLMHGAEYDEMVAALKAYQDQMNIVVAEPLLGEVGADGTIVNDDKKTVAEAVVAAADIPTDTALVLMGHGTAHEANVTYTQMQTMMNELGYNNVFVGTVEGEPEGTDAASIIEKVKAAGYKNVVLRPLMVVAGDHANNDMADPEDPESWISQFTASGAFESVDCQIAGLGRISDVQALYVSHTGVFTWEQPAEKADAKVTVNSPKTFKAKALKKAKAKFAAIKVTTDGKVTYKVTKNSNPKAISFKDGKVIVKKGTAKGTYTLKVKVSAKEGDNYKALKAKAYKVKVVVK